MSRVVVLLSGGLDSAVALAQQLEQGNDVWPIWFRYGQRHAERERQAMRSIALHYGLWERVEFHGLDLSRGSNLTGTGPLDNTSAVVDLRNPLMLLHATRYALSLEAERVIIGCNYSDAADFFDCRRGTLAKANELIAACGYGVTVEAPLIDLLKSAVVKEGRRLGAPLELTWSCYTGGQEPCHNCGACQERVMAFYHEEIAVDA